LKILIFEYITGGGLRHKPLPPALAQEGELMLRALTDDLLTLPEVELTVFSDDRLAARQSSLGAAELEMVHVGESDNFQALWREWVARCDAIWPIAPETGGVLEHLCEDVESRGKTLLNSPASAVRLAASKRATLNRLKREGLAVAPTLPLIEWAETSVLIENRRVDTSFILKPDDGVGCEGTQVIRGSADLAMAPNAENWIVQSLLEGESLSLSALFAKGRARLLSCNRQLVARAGSGFILQGCLVNAIPDDAGVWQNLSDEIARAIPELWGYAGIDLILTETGPVILEINPRLTTSYAGLREATSENTAALVLGLLTTGELPPPRNGYGKRVEIRPEKIHEH
jgi:predicted ATP-grasp superfamily ATP-dependent carboligase